LNETSPRTFEEARGMVMNDYQNKLEDQWIAELKKKYPVKINEAVFKTLPK
jgi:peptidyl-prolyl cis-trans isomerase SurA